MKSFPSFNKSLISPGLLVNLLYFKIYTEKINSFPKQNPYKIDEIILASKIIFIDFEHMRKN